jgi:hypothetical protein
MEGLELLQRLIGVELYGETGPNGHRPGLYQIIIASQDWETFTRTKGLIQGYESALKMIEEVIQRLNEPPQRAAPVHGRPN